VKQAMPFLQSGFLDVVAVLLVLGIAEDEEGGDNERALRVFSNI